MTKEIGNQLNKFLIKNMNIFSIEYFLGTSDTSQYYSLKQEIEKLGKLKDYGFTSQFFLISNLSIDKIYGFIKQWKKDKDYKFIITDLSNKQIKFIGLPNDYIVETILEKFWQFLVFVRIILF